MKQKLGLPMRQLILVCSFCLLFFALHAQEFGGNPTSVKWSQINNEAVKIIYPKGMDSAAARVATISALLQERYNATIGATHHKISIVLQPDVNFSNGYVGLGPYRSEFFMMPPQNPFVLGSNSWTDNLAIHEFRHVQQYSNFNVGLSKFMGVLFGQNGRALANAASVPDWFFEGDAVWNETVLSGQGRGRLPLFLSSYKTVFRDGRNYSFMKMRNGSLRQYVPNHYELGYLLVSYGRQVYGDSIWKNVSNDAASFKSLFYPLQGAVKRSTGLKYAQFVQQAMNDYREKWKSQQAEEPAWITTASKTKVINYQFPYPSDNRAIIVLKTADDQIPTFVKKGENGDEENIAVKDIGYDEYFSYKNGRIIYTALQPDVRWGNRDYSIIKVLDIKSKSLKTITAKSRYFSPDVSNDGNKLVAVRMNLYTPSALVLLDVNGNEQQQFIADSSYIFSHPKFLSNEEEILVAVRKTNGDMGWLIWRVNDNSSRWLLPPSNRLVGFPVVKSDTVFYTATEGQTDGLYAQSISTGQRFLVANYATGIYQGFTENGKMVGSFFTADGFRLGSLPAGFATILPESSGFKTLYGNADHTMYENLNNVASKSYSVSKYKKGFQPLNIHSWQPELNEPQYTFRLYGNNVINTVLTDIFYTYNTNETSHALGANVRYGAWYVQPIVGVKQTWSRDVVYNADTTFHFNESELSGGLVLPLNLTGGKSFRSLTISSMVHSNKVRWQGIGKDLLRNLDFTYFEGRLAYTSQIQKARQHIYPRIAQALTASYKTMIDKNVANQLLFTGSFYLPGISQNHNLVISAAWQGRDTMRQYAHTNIFPFSRGYTAVNFPRMWMAGANYHFPVFYPDWGFGNMVYFLRVRANGFYDYTEVKSLRTGLTRQFRSAGCEMFFDTKWWNQLPVSFGVRYSRLLDSEFSGQTQANQWEFILPVNLF
jgi:hypothetical protein